MGSEPDVLFDSATLVPAGERPAFGPEFFVAHLKRFLRKECPDPDEELPVVTIQLTTGEVIELCHVISLAPRYVSLAAYEGARTTDRKMKTEIVAYESITRIVVRRGAARAGPGNGRGTRKDAEELMEAARGPNAPPASHLEWTPDSE